MQQGALDVFPGSVLRQDGANDDFEAGTAGPPMLRAVSGEESFEVRAEDSVAGRWRPRANRRLGTSRRSAKRMRLRGMAERARRSSDNLRQRCRNGHLKGTITVTKGQVKKA